MAIPDAPARAKTLVGHNDAVHGIGFSPDGRRLATASSDNTVRVWDPETGVNVLTVPFDAAVWLVVWSPDGERLAALPLNRTVAIPDAVSPRERRADRP